MVTLFQFFAGLANAAQMNDHTAFLKLTQELQVALDKEGIDVFEQSDDFLDAYTQIIDYAESGKFTIDAKDAIVAIGALAYWWDL